jgi:hypothetical protein
MNSYQVYRQGNSWIVTYGRSIVGSFDTKAEANAYIEWHRGEVKRAA